MIEANRVHSTPPLNTSAKGITRRRLLARDQRALPKKQQDAQNDRQYASANYNDAKPKVVHDL